MPHAGTVSRARTLVRRLGGRFSLELGIDVDGGQREIERWALASTLLGMSVPGDALLRSWGALAAAGIDTIAATQTRPPGDLVAFLDLDGMPGQGRRVARRLHVLATVLEERHGGSLASVGRALEDPHELCRTLTGLPGWGPATARTFLRELRGVWPGAWPALGARAAAAAAHAHVPSSLNGLIELAGDAHVDLRDLEAGLCRLAAVHDLTTCPGGEECPFVSLGPRRYVRA
jgi:hypothetical protein